MTKRFLKFLAAPTLLFCSAMGFAAQSVDLSANDTSVLKPFAGSVSLKGSNAAATSSEDKLVELSRSTDNQFVHVRMQQTHNGYPVWGTVSIVHSPVSQGFSKTSLTSLIKAPVTSNTTMDGTVYQGISADLSNTPAYVFNQEQANKAVDQAIALTKSKSSPTEKSSQLMVYVDEQNKSHWAFLTSLYYPSTKTNPAPSYPKYLLDAQTLKVYKQWNDVQSESEIAGGGLGGNKKHELVYDGLTGDLAALDIMRTNGICYLSNEDGEVHDYRVVSQEGAEDVPVSFKCGSQDAKHNNVYWDGSFDEANGGYSPSNDALFTGSVVKQVYKQWYDIEMMLNDDGTPKKLIFYTHAGDNWENAVWDGKNEVMYLGDGENRFYPLTSLGVVAHEVSHGFTQHHSGLIYEGQSGGLNESYSDMAAQAAEFFADGKSSWQIGAEISKGDDVALRYLDQPSKDCQIKDENGNLPVQCSIDNVRDYNERLNVHYSSGIFNRVFYLLAHSQGWDVKKAFGVMVTANAKYWTPTTNFKQAACGVLKAAKSKSYDLTAIQAAVKEVGIDASDCRL